MLKPVGLINGHYECRALDETLPVFTDLLAMVIVARTDGRAIVRHPNTDWPLIVHEGGPHAPDKPHNNHYGFRVANPEEIEATWRYIQEHREAYGITRVTKPHAIHFATSIYFHEPGGNDVEIEYYDPQAVAEGRSIAAPHWTSPLPEDRFPARGYIPQALTHGTLQCDDKAASDRFYREVLGLQLAGGGRISTYIKHPATPWYIVVLPARSRRHLTPSNRFTLQLASPGEVEDAHREFATSGPTLGVTSVEDVQHQSGSVGFLFSDLDHNWWEVTATA